MKRILIVDDNLVSLQQINVQLANNYTVMLAKSGAQALQICMEEVPDLIVLDIEMPGMDGFETIIKFKQHIALSQIPVIFLTGSHDTPTAVKALQSGANDFLTKPVERDILLHRIGLHLRLSQYQRNLEQTVRTLEDSLVASFSDMIEYRDRNTGSHVARTGKYVELLGRELMAEGLFANELSEHSLEMIMRAAPLHDVGKIGISDVILLKPDMLDDEEFTVMKSHTVIGARMLQNMYLRTPTQKYLEYAALIAESHHEKYNGKGYPHGLAGEDIPLCARIMAVADVYDALIGDRVYRKAMSHAEACRIICAGKGTQFDPAVVSAFRAVQEKFEAIVRGNGELA